MDVERSRVEKFTRKTKNERKKGSYVQDGAKCRFFVVDIISQEILLVHYFDYSSTELVWWNGQKELPTLVKL